MCVGTLHSRFDYLFIASAALKELHLIKHVQARAAADAVAAALSGVLFQGLVLKALTLWPTFLFSTFFRAPPPMPPRSGTLSVRFSWGKVSEPWPQTVAQSCI